MRQRKRAYEVLLVSSVSRPDRWTLPKGGIEAGEAPEVAASREIAEEAGVRGRLSGALGVVARESKRIAFFLFQFTHDVAWMEVGMRKRRWVRLEGVERHLGQTDLHDIVEAARRSLGAR